MIMKKWFTLSVFALSGFAAKAQEITQDRMSKADMIKLDFTALQAKKKLVKAKDASVLKAYQFLIKKADSLLDFKPVSVMDKKDVPPSGNKHDYMSIAPYWWPDPSKPSGTPYIKRDGEINPEVQNFTDKVNMPALCENVYQMALAYYFTNDEKYAKHAALLVKVWFIDTATRMNPNLNYAQAVKGVIAGRAEGLIDTRHFIYLIDGLQLINASKNWGTDNQKAIKQWFSAFLTWMNTSKNGQAEMNAKNNHGVWFDAQNLAVALFVDSTEMANQIVTRAAGRLNKQMDNTGFFPLELARTTSLHYSAFIMNAFNIIATLSEKTTTNFWEVTTPNGNSYKKGIEALSPFLMKEKEWTGKEIRPFNYVDGYPLLLRSATKYGSNHYLEGIKKIGGDKSAQQLVNLL